MLVIGDIGCRGGRVWGLPVRSLGFHCKSTIVLENIAYLKKNKKGYEVRRVGRATIDGIVRENL